jgi:predicted nucleotidyltransferase
MDSGTEPFLTSRIKTGTIQSERMSSMIHEKITHYFETRHEVAAVYLFGSFASEKNRLESDVDLAILFLPEQLPSADRFCSRYLTELGRILRKDIHPVVMNRAGEVLLKQIFLKGKRLVINNPTYVREFNMFAMSRIADFGFYLNRMQAGLKKKIQEAAHG